MPKRKRDKDSDDYILRKLRKLEKRLKKRRSLSESTNGSDAHLSSQTDNQMEEPVDSIDGNVDIQEDNVIGVSTTEPQNQDCAPQILDLDSQNIELEPDVPSTSKACSVILDESIREMLGENPTKNKPYSSPIQSDLADSWEHIATSGLTKEVKKELLGKYFLPENCQRLGAPKLNPEIKAALSETLAKKDAAIETKQNQKGVAIACIGHALTRIFASQNKDVEVIKYLIDASKLLCDSQYHESMSRRSFVTSTIKKDFKDQLFTTQIDSNLFGEKLADTLKAAKAINKSGAEMKSVVLPKPGISRSLNVRPPFPQARQAGAGRRPTPAMSQPRRYQTPAPPLPSPPAPRAATYRPPPPPPPVQPQRSRARTNTRR